MVIKETMIKGPEDWLVNHTTKHYDCPNCLTFEADEICSHQVSDHNIYAVCKEILSDSELLPGGFLHSVPVPQLLLINHFIEECIQPREFSRFETAERIMYLLKKYI